jgi:MOSC domain-containing protein YiiM
MKHDISNTEMVNFRYNSDSMEMETETKTNTAKVLSVALSAEPGMPKYPAKEIHLRAAWGVEGDYHAGEKVRHRYLAKKYPNRANKRQINLVHAELFGRVAAELGVTVTPGALGENITTVGLDLMHLPVGTRLQIGESAIIELTEPRVPCKNLDYLDKRLMKLVANKGQPVKDSGYLGIVVESGVVRPGDTIKRLTIDD